MNLHVICKHQENWRRVGDNQFETWEWVVSDETANEIVSSGGWIYLHEKQKENAWHGGPAVQWRSMPDDPRRKVFVYRVTGQFRIKCLSGWGQEMAIVRN